MNGAVHYREAERLASEAREAARLHGEEPYALVLAALANAYATLANTGAMVEFSPVAETGEVYSPLWRAALFGEGEPVPATQERESAPRPVSRETWVYPGDGDWASIEVAEHEDDRAPDMVTVTTNYLVAREGVGEFVASRRGQLRDRGFVPDESRNTGAPVENGGGA